MSYAPTHSRSPFDYGRTATLPKPSRITASKSNSLQPRATITGIGCINPNFAAAATVLKWIEDGKQVEKLNTTLVGRRTYEVVLLARDSSEGVAS
jgi:hypothetical protein